MTATDIFSIDHLVTKLQRPVQYIEAAAEKLNLAAVLRINNVPHYDAGQVELLSNELDKRRRVEQLLASLEAEQARFRGIQHDERLRETGRRLASGAYERFHETTKPTLDDHRAKILSALQECRRLLKHVGDATPEALEAIRVGVAGYREVWTVVNVECMEASV